MPLRLIFMGTPDFAVPTLLALAAAGHDIAAVYTRAAKPAGRGMELQRTPVEREARRLGLPVLTPATLKTPEAQAEFAAFKADAAVVVAYGLILPKAVLEAPRLGCFNVHASLLPRWRGAAPINRAVMTGDHESGVTIMRMDEGLDTGAMAMVRSHADRPRHDRRRTARRAGATRRRADAARDWRPPNAARSCSRRSQTKASPTRRKSPRPKPASIGLRPWNEVHNHIRGLSPFPGAWFELGGVRIKALRTTKGQGSGAPGTVLDDHLTSRLRRRRHKARASSARR